MVFITRIKEDQLVLESDRGIIGHSYELERLISKLKTRGCEIRRTGHNGLCYVIGNARMVSQWNKANIPLNKKIHGKI